jgi:hypothetical protein
MMRNGKKIIKHIVIPVTGIAVGGSQAYLNYMQAEELRRRNGGSGGSGNNNDDDDKIKKKILIQIKTQTKTLIQIKKLKGQNLNSYGNVDFYFLNFF